MGRPSGDCSDRIQISGSVGPAGSIRSGLPIGGFIFTRSFVPPNGLGGIEPGFILQRRLKTWFGCAPLPQATRAGAKLLIARATPSTIREIRKGIYSLSVSLRYKPVQVGALCVCVAEIRMRSAGKPLFS